MPKPFRACHVHITGLGLMGGSLAMALRDQVQRLTASDMDAGILRAAQDTGVIDGVDESTQADIVVLAIPADQIIDLVPALEIRTGTLVIDLGSTKTRICEALDHLPEGVRAVGGHPMCGLAENGYANAFGTLYRGARFVLCETVRTDATARAWSEALVAAAGAQPIWLDRVQHDYLTALTSHLPHLLSFALMGLAMEAAGEDSVLYDLAAGGFDGATRLARTDAGMIAGMFSTNATQLRAVVARLQARLQALERELDDAAQLRADLGEIVAARRAYTAAYGERLIT